MHEWNEMQNKTKSYKTCNPCTTLQQARTSFGGVFHTPDPILDSFGPCQPETELRCMIQGQLPKKHIYQHNILHIKVPTNKMWAKPNAGLLKCDRTVITNLNSRTRGPPNKQLRNYKMQIHSLPSFIDNKIFIQYLIIRYPQ